jgi:hypothetical protein
MSIHAPPMFSPRHPPPTHYTYLPLYQLSKRISAKGTNIPWSISWLTANSSRAHLCIPHALPHIHLDRHTEGSSPSFGPRLLHHTRRVAPWNHRTFSELERHEHHFRIYSPTRKRSETLQGRFNRASLAALIHKQIIYTNVRARAVL